MAGVADEEHVSLQTEEALSTLSKRIFAERSCDDWITRRRPEVQNAEWLTVDACPDFELVGTNCVYSHEETFHAFARTLNQDSWDRLLHSSGSANGRDRRTLRIGFGGSPVTYVLRPSSRMRPGCIGLNTLQRRNLDTGLGQTLLVQAITDDAGVDFLASIEFEIESATPR